MRFTCMLILLSALLGSCRHYYYMPNVHNVPLFKEKNEYRIHVALNGGDETNSTELQAACSITGQIAVMTNIMLAKGGEKDGGNWGKGNYIDGAAGYYKALGKSGVFEVYGGFGISNQQHQYNSNNNYYIGRSDLAFMKLFVQPSIGATFSGFDIAFSTRLGRLSFYRVNNQISQPDAGEEFYYLDMIARNKNAFLVEPAITLRGGWKQVKLQLQAGSIINPPQPDIRFETVHMSIGLCIAIADRFRRNRPPG